MFIVQKELSINPVSIEISLFLHPLSLCRLLCWSVVAATNRFSWCGIGLVMISQLGEHIPPRLAMPVS